MASDITGSVEMMEAEAARVMEEARARAAEILAKSRDEARKMASEQLPLDDVKAECARIVQEATKQTAADMKQAEAHAAEIKAKSAGKADEYVKSMVRVVLGEKLG